MKEVLISIQPKWCELIASGKKTVEVRKTKPKLETPFKVYIYCTLQGSNEFFKEDCGGDVAKWNRSKMSFKKGKVIGEFVCDAIISHCEMANADIAEQQGCIKREMLFEYSNVKELYGWHISNLVIYDKPRELSEFRSYYTKAYIDQKTGLPMPTHEITRPPQSWSYVESEVDTK